MLSLFKLFAIALITMQACHAAPAPNLQVTDIAARELEQHVYGRARALKYAQPTTSPATTQPLAIRGLPTPAPGAAVYRRGTPVNPPLSTTLTA